MTGLHLAAYFGAEEIVMGPPSKTLELDLRDGDDRTPLSWAAGNGHEAVVRLLLETGQVEPDSKQSGTFVTPLSPAAEYEHEAVVRQLLETARSSPTRRTA
jgi:ankyrin repeat protein